MDKWLRWLTRGVHLTLHRRGVAARDADALPSFEHIDGAQLDAGDFRASEAMRLDALARRDFAETMPGFTVSAPAAQGRHAVAAFDARAR